MKRSFYTVFFVFIYPVLNELNPTLRYVSTGDIQEKAFIHTKNSMKKEKKPLDKRSLERNPVLKIE
ncbi:MAG: hypothetical protein C5B45_04885 [Chlamydiae bacterium]|nr:MAG: hypothetical protein C5B45_04885 [Chlamydiota bacterium]